MTVAADSPETFLDAGFRLPALPVVSERVMRSIESGEATADQIAKLLESDASLVAQILKLVNSAYYGLPRKIAHVRHAVAYLGLTEIHRLALTVSVMTTLAPDDRAAFEAFWRHSFFTALAAKKIAQSHERTLDPAHLYTAALLHDVGKLIYLKYFPDRYNQLETLSESRSLMMYEMEQELDWPSHSRLGTLVCERWELPETVRLACEHHELSRLEAHNDGERLEDYLRILCVANLLANLAEGDLDEGHRSRIREATVRALGCGDEEFLPLMGELYELRTDVDRFLTELG